MNKQTIKDTIKRLNRERRSEIPAMNMEGKTVRRPKSAFQIELENRLKKGVSK